MSPAKVIAFLLCLASLALLLIFGFVAFAGPPLLGETMPPPWPLDKLGNGCLGLVLFATSLPFIALPGLAGIGLWLFVVRKQETATDGEVMAGVEREAAFQSRLDALTLRLLERSGDATALASEIPIWTTDLDGSRQNRLLRLLAACGGDGAGETGTPALAMVEAATESPDWGARALSLGLLGLAAFCTLWGAFVAYSYLTSDLLALSRGLAPNRTAAAVAGSGSCFVIALAALLGGLALRWLTQRETRRSRQLAAARQSARDVALESCRLRIERLLRQENDTVPQAEAAGRIARAHVLSTLPELDGAGKGRLIAWLHAGSLLSRLTLAGADLRGAALAATDLSAAVLAGTDLSGAVLTGARLVQADLRGSRLRAADLRDAEAAGADLREADLRLARMHRCNLRQADLRGADLQGANLWQAHLPAPADGTGEAPS